MTWKIGKTLIGISPWYLLEISEWLVPRGLIGKAISQDEVEIILMHFRTDGLRDEPWSAAKAIANLRIAKIL